MSHLKIKFANRFKYLRKQHGYSQEQLADKIDMAIESVSNIERAIHGPQFDNLEKIASVLDVEVKDLFDFNDTPET